MLASTLSLDGSKDDSATKGWRDLGMEPSLADEYDYVCHGKIYRFEEGDEETMYVLLAFFFFFSFFPLSSLFIIGCDDHLADGGLVSLTIERFLPPLADCCCILRGHIRSLRR